MTRTVSSKAKKDLSWLIVCTRIYRKIANAGWVRSRFLTDNPPLRQEISNLPVEKSVTKSKNRIHTYCINMKIANKDIREFQFSLEFGPNLEFSFELFGFGSVELMMNPSAFVSIICRGWAFLRKKTKTWLWRHPSSGQWGLKEHSSCHCLPLIPEGLSFFTCLGEPVPVRDRGIQYTRPVYKTVEKN